MVAALADSGDEHDLLADLSLAADPDQALRLLARFLESCSPQLRARVISTVTAEPDVGRRLIDVLGMSEALGEFLIRHPEQWQVLADGERIAQAPGAKAVRETLLRAVGADPHLPEPVASSDDVSALDALRIAYREQLLGIAARDLVGLAPMGVVASWLSDLADAVLEAQLPAERRRERKEGREGRQGAVLRERRRAARRAELERSGGARRCARARGPLTSRTPCRSGCRTGRPAA